MVVSVFSLSLLSSSKSFSSYESTYRPFSTITTVLPLLASIMCDLFSQLITYVQMHFVITKTLFHAVDFRYYRALLKNRRTQFRTSKFPELYIEYERST